MISISVAKLLELYHRIQKTADIILLCATFTVVILRVFLNVIITSVTTLKYCRTVLTTATVYIPEQ